MDEEINKRVIDSLTKNLMNFEEQYQSLVDALPDILYSFSIDRGGVYFSPSVTRILGYTPEYLLNHPLLWTESIHQDDHDIVKSAIQNFLLGKHFEIEYRMRHANGQWIWLRDRSVRIQLLEGEPIIQGIATDITEIRDATARLGIGTHSGIGKQEQTIGMLQGIEKGYFQLFENMLNGFAYCKIIYASGTPVDFVYLQVNQAFETLTGLKDVTGKLVSEVIPGIQISDDELFQKYARVAQSGTPERFEYYLKALNEWFDISVYSPEQGYFIALFDVTTSQHWLFDTMVQGVVYQDTEGSIFSANPAAEKLLGLSLDQMMGKTSMYPDWKAVREDGTALPGSDHPSMVALRTGTTVGPIIMGVFNPKLESLRWISIRAIPLFKTGAASPFQVYTTFEDITERKQAEAELVASRQKLKVALESMNDAIFISDSEGRFIEFNDAFATFHRFTSKKECAVTLGEYPDIIDVFMADGKPAPVDQWAVPRALRGETASNAEYTLRRKDTGETWVGSYSFAPIRNEDSIIVGSVVTGRDITDHKLMEKRLEQSNIELEFQVSERTKELTTTLEKLEKEHNERNRIGKELIEKNVLLNSAAHIAHLGTWKWNISDNSNVWSEEQFRILGISTTVQPSYEEFFNTLHPDDHDKIATALKQTLENNTPYDLEGRVIWPDGEIRHIHCQGEVQRDETGKPVSMIGTILDVTDRKLAERELMGARDAAQSANHAKSEFLSNMSHEIRTPLNAIFGMSQLLQFTTLDAEQLECLNAIKMSSDNLLSLINDILDLSKIESGKVELESRKFGLRTSINDIIKTQISQIHHKGLSLITDIPISVPDSLIGDQLRLKQILLNLLGNAIKFTEHGRITVAVTVTEQHVSNVLLNISVTDTGIGISHESIEKIFKPFCQADASTTRKYGGTGLGLTICSRLTELLGGKIWVESVVGVGTTFTILVPFALNGSGENRAISEYASNKTTTWDRPPIRILIAEDDDNSLLFMTKMLGKFGHSPLVARNGEEAVAMWRQKECDVILMDVQMPGMDGIEATRIIRTVEADTGGHIPIIATTAYALHDERERIMQLGFDGYVSKPLVIEEFIDVMKRVVGGGP